MYAILRISKLKTMHKVSGCGNHIARNKQPKNADPERSHLNRNLTLKHPDLATAVQERLPAKVRKNSVLAVEHMLTATPEFFQDKDQAEIHTWAEVNLNWLNERYGKENVVGAHLHMDETTPHIHAVIVPRIDERLSARDYFGGSQKMKDMQTSYAKCMQEHGYKLQRGVEGSKAKHTSIKQFYNAINTAEELKKDRPVKQGLMDRDYPKRLEKYIQQAESVVANNSILKKKYGELEKTAHGLEKNVKNLSEAAQKQQKYMKSLERKALMLDEISEMAKVDDSLRQHIRANKIAMEKRKQKKKPKQKETGYEMDM